MRSDVQWHNRESNPRAPHISLTNSLRHPLHFALGRKPFELKRLVSVCSTQLSMELYKLYVCRFVSCFTGLAEMFRGQTCSADRTWREALVCFTQVPSSYGVGIQRIYSCGIYKIITGYWKANTRWDVKVTISCIIAYKRALSRMINQCEKSIKFKIQWYQNIPPV